MDEMKEDVGLSEQLAGGISTTLYALIKGRGDEDGNDLTPFASDSPDNDNPSTVFEVRVRFVVVVVVAAAAATVVTN